MKRGTIIKMKKWVNQNIKMLTPGSGTLVNVFLFSFVCLLVLGGTSGAASKTRDRVYVKRAVDGDTLLLRSGERVRLIGVDTPESVHRDKPVEYFALEASNFTKKMAQKKFVWLEYGSEPKDIYDRILAYVYLEDGTFLNAELIKQGYAFAYRKFPHRFLDDFQEYERQARFNAVGLWGRFSRGRERYDVIWIGSKKKKEYHHPSCFRGAALPKNDLVRFYSKHQPRDKRFKPCWNCAK